MLDVFDLMLKIHNLIGLAVSDWPKFQAKIAGRKIYKDSQTINIGGFKAIG